MRHRPRLLALGVVGVALTGLLGQRARALLIGPTKDGPGSSPEDPLINRPSEPRGGGAVIATSLIATAALGCGLAWYGIDQAMRTRAVAVALTHGTPERAPPLFTRYGCAGCHTVPGFPGADGQVGPDLSGLQARVYIGGVLRNTPDNLVDWIVDPQRFSPGSAMPATGITQAEARDVAAYLYVH